ncbi:MAG: ribosome recycling factor [Clostridium sp.]
MDSKFEDKMKNIVDHLVQEFSEIRTGRANPTILNRINVEYYGVLTPINQVAGISVPEARLIVVQPWDVTLLKQVEKAIIEANIGITPQNDGKVIRLAFPELTQERRLEIVKNIKELTEKSKVAIRNVRREAIDEAKMQEKNKEISQDDLEREEEQIQKLTDKYINIIEEKFSVKEKEIKTV